MVKGLFVTGLIAFASAMSPVAACDWEREASTAPQTVAAATTDQTQQAAPACTGANCNTPAATSVASDQAVRKTVDEQWPILQVSDRK